MIRDFSKYALNLYSKPSNSDAQKEYSLKVIMGPVPNEKRFLSVWEKNVYALKGTYKMND